MARIVYALSGQGRGHASRVMAVSNDLRERGHEILFCCGGTAREILDMQGEPVLHVPSLKQIMEENEVRVLQTLRCNWDSIVNLGEIVSDLADSFTDFGPDLVITDFEAFSHRAAARLGLPVISFNHQQIVTETKYTLPIKYRFDAAMTALAVRLIAPSRPERILITSFFFPPLKNPASATLIPPIIRPAVSELSPSRGDHVLVYYNHTDGAEQVLETLRKVDARFIVYNFSPDFPEEYPNVSFKQPCLDEFLYDLASSRAVISTAGFTLISEALFLGKPLLVVPNRGIFEQTLNALFLERNGLGAAVVDRPLTLDDVEKFLERQPAYEERLQGRESCGNKEAVACIESVLSRISHPTFPRSPIEAVAAASVAPSVGSLD